MPGDRANPIATCQTKPSLFPHLLTRRFRHRGAAKHPRAAHGSTKPILGGKVERRWNTDCRVWESALRLGAKYRERREASDADDRSRAHEGAALPPSEALGHQGSLQDE